MRGKFVLILLILASLTTRGQVRKPFIIESRVHSGLNLPFYKALDYLIEDDLYAFDIAIRFPASGKDQWEKIFHYPATGIGYSWWTLGNDEILGHAHAIYGFMSFPLTSSNARFRTNIQISAGTAYLPRNFDLYNNHLNRAIGSPLNIYIRLGLDVRTKISPVSEIILEAGTSHFSNGKTSSPNYGINTGSISMGINYFFNKGNFILKDPEVPASDRRIIQTIQLSAGRKVYDNLLGNKYLSSTFSYNAERFVNPGGKAGLGADIFYDGSIAEGLQEAGAKPENSPEKLMRIGLHGSYALRYKRFHPGIQLGYYIYSKYTVLTNIYSKVALQYALTDNISASVSVRSHLGKADALEYGLGYTW